MAEYIEKWSVVNRLIDLENEFQQYKPFHGFEHAMYRKVCEAEISIGKTPDADVAPVRHGRWILEAHDERVNYRWNVTAECSECCDEQKEIWAGFFPGVPPSIARSAALVSAESVKLSNYCPNCGAKMNGKENDHD